ncbi:uncharacterized protein LOC132756995 [Ruditapes philippinarum]|uniref:uncharacterized protein LOC132756995 n=1 Tax=Ruditapes philippinarum TaxID=129788 RepID=UPI00295B03E0|nr:uncharacterized protein LOC132756995 [Ruditapes philippinarum]
MDQLVFLPVQNLRFKDLFDWSIPVQRCKSSKVILTPPASPRKNGVVIPHKDKEHGTLTQANEQDIALFRYKTRVYAVKEECPHAGGPLHLGDIEELADELVVRCPWHGWKIDLETGKVKFPKGHDLQSTLAYPVKVTEDGKLYIGFNGLYDGYFNVEDCDF